MDRIREFLSFAGKREHKLAAVFGISPGSLDHAVRHLRSGAPGLPIWLFSTAQPLPETAVLCERVFVERDSLALLVLAQKELWPHWVALSVGAWTGEHGRWPVKLAPLLIPPFRALLLNRYGDFFDAAPATIFRHIRRGARDAAHSGWNRVKDLHRGAWLWLFALLAQRFSFLSRWAFRRMHGSQPLELAPESRPSAGAVTFRHRQRQWNWQELDHLVRTSDARWILFLEGDTEDNLPFWDDERIFALSRQPGYRDWKACLFAMAPFRRLAPGEISRTLAPVSSAMLVDRRKLAALGVPKTIVPGAAWLLLFWKAAASGWHSYSIGSSRALDELPDWPYEEAEFVTRVLSDGELRRLGPRDPDLARGNIAIVGPPWGSPAGCAGLSGRPRVLIVSPYLPYPLSHGGAVRIYNLCRALSGRVEFLLACFREKNDTVDYAKLHEIFRRVWVVDRDEKPAGNPAFPAQVRQHASRSMRALIGAVCREERIDLLQIEYTHLAAFRDAAPNTPAILVEHDLTFLLYRQFAEREPNRAACAEYDRWHDFERHWLSRYDAVWTMSENDRRAAIEAGSPAEATFAVPNGVDLERFTPAPDPDHAQEILYVGSFRHRPNLLGFEKLRREIMPRVWNRFPQARLRVVAGPEPERYRRESSALDPRIHVHAFVEDLRPLYAQASVVVVPLLVSAGTNIKVLEAMACAKAVVTTSVGCAGLNLADGRDALIRDDWSAFAEAVAGLLAGCDLRRRLAAEARRTVEARFAWEAIAGQAYASYVHLAGVPAR